MIMSEGRRFIAGERGYILNPSDYLPVFIGYGHGDLDYKEAVELSIVRRTAMGLNASREFICAVAGHSRDKSRSHPSAFRASKNNPYTCIHCGYKTTRCANMLKHLENLHNDRATDPRADRS